MPLLQALLIRLCLFWLPVSTILAAPVDPTGNQTMTRRDEMDVAKVWRRVPGDRDHPVDATFDITNWPNIAEEDCFAMLCLEGGKRLYQRVATAGASDGQYRGSGAALRAFRADQTQTRHTAQINTLTTSAEEFPWESMQEGGVNAYVFPATPDEQSSQGGIISSTYDRDGVGYNAFFTVTFQPATSFGPYCTALFSSPPDFSLCQNNNLKQTLWGISNVILSNFVWSINKATLPSMMWNQLAGRGGGTQHVDGVDILWEAYKGPDQDDGDEHTEEDTEDVEEDDGEEDSLAMDSDDDGDGAG